MSLRTTAVVPLICLGLVTPQGLGCGRQGAAPVGVSTDAVPNLVRELKDRNPRTRARSAVALGRIGPDAKEAVSALTEALKDRDVSVKAAAAYSLGQIGPEARSALPALKALKAQKSLREVTTAAIEKIGP